VVLRRFSRSTGAARALKKILATDSADMASDFGKAGLRLTKSVKIRFWSTKAEGGEVTELAKKVRALIRRRGRANDGSTVAEVLIEDRRTGRVY
jgi:hypothetical protein